MQYSVNNIRILAPYGYFAPEQIASSNLWKNLHEALANAGIDCVVYTPLPTRGVSQDTREYYKDHNREVLFDGSLIIHRFYLVREKSNSLLRALRYFLSANKQFIQCVLGKDARNCNLLFVVSTPPIQGAMAALVKRIRGIPLIYDLQDVFPDSLIGSGLAKKGGLLWKIGRKIEDFTYRNADKIIVISEDFKRNIMAKGVPEEKIEVIYNWVDTDSILPVPKPDNPLFEEFGIDRDKFTAVYAGNLGNAQNINIILDGAARVPEVQFVLFGTGGLEDEIRSRIVSEGLGNVRLLPLQPYERVSQVYSLGDVCIVSCKPGFGGSAMPSKTWSILSCARPVIASFDEGELKDILEKNDCGVFTHAGDAEEFAAGIKALAASPAHCVQMGLNGRHFILDNLTKEVGTRKYVEVIRSFEKTDGRKENDKIA